MAVPPTEEEPRSPGHRIELVDDHPSPRHDGESSPGLRDSKGWDGKLRVPRSAVLANPEALSDPEYSDDENVMPGDEVAADEDLLDGEDPDTDEIVCTHSRISSIPALRLERFKQVARICLRQNVIQDIEGLSSLAPTLVDLDLYDNLISHIRGLDDLVNLTSLDLSFNKIKHIKHISHLTNLTDLFFVANKISRIDGLSGLTKLRNLELGSNRIRELENLSSLSALEELWVAKNKITSLAGLAGLPKLRLLSIQSNRVCDLSPLRDAPQLEELYISHNALESLRGLEHNTALRILEVSNNHVASLAGLGPLAALEELWASYNQIGDFAEVERELGDKRALTTVYFEGNPLQRRGPAVYRNKVRLALPQLRQIDASGSCCLFCSPRSCFTCMR
ncbi:L domain-like protein [Parathielavia hyrcaniae]|uniref:L domain-like protein n=1 Tax=Parathielavia hyrcaniae TaxID=113614 RepID=A0AAN6Q1K9_9PEZI|nr:L domain-like protein [Parathielavia hyrcaniae]